MSLGSSLGFLKAYGTGKRFFIFLVVVYLSVCFLFRLSQTGTVKYYAQIHLQVWQNSVCTGQGNLPLII